MNRNLLVLSLLMIASLVFGQTKDWTRLMVEGNKKYKEGKFEDSQKIYEQSQVNSSKPYVSKYNLGNSQYKQENYPEAVKSYDQAYRDAKTDREKSQALYNKGNAHFKTQKYDDAIENYKNALKYSPTDQQIIQDLAKSKLKKVMQPPPPPQDGKDNQKNKDKQDQEQQKDQNKQDQQNNENQDKNENQDGQPSENKQNNENQKNPSEKLSKGEVERLLQMVENEEKDIQNKMRKTNQSSKKKSKNW